MNPEHYMHTNIHYPPPSPPSLLLSVTLALANKSATHKHQQSIGGGGGSQKSPAKWRQLTSSTSCFQSLGCGDSFMSSKTVALELCKVYVICEYNFRSYTVFMFLSIVDVHTSNVSINIVKVQKQQNTGKILSDLAKCNSLMLNVYHTQ